MKKLLIAGAVAAGALLSATGQAIGACGSVSIAEMNWASAQLMANVDKIVLEEGYGCKVEIVPGDTMPTFTSMNEKGAPDVAGELWINAVANPLAAAKAEGLKPKVKLQRSITELINASERAQSCSALARSAASGLVSAGPKRCRPGRTRRLLK